MIQTRITVETIVDGRPHELRKWESTDPDQQREVRRGLSDGLRRVGDTQTAAQIDNDLGQLEQLAQQG
jgi:hypothetical protein